MLGNALPALSAALVRRLPGARRITVTVVGIQLALATALLLAVWLYGSRHAATPDPASLALLRIALSAALASLLLNAVLTLGWWLAHRRIDRLETARLGDSHAALHDALTGAANRRQFEQLLDELVTEPCPAHALLMIDLDRFKPVNDIYGHAAGDQLLKDVTALLSQRVRGTDLVARLGGDEFAIVLRKTTLDSAESIATEALETVRRYRLTWDGQRVGVGASIGVVMIDRPGLTAATLIEAADTGLYAAKDAGRNTVFRVRLDEDGVSGPPERVDRDAGEALVSARSHEPEDGNRQVLMSSALIDLSTLGPRAGVERVVWVAAEPETQSTGAGPGLGTRELLDDAGARADGGADFVRWTLGMLLLAFGQLPKGHAARLGVIVPVPARALATVPTLARELADRLALNTTRIPHLTFVLHDLVKVQHDPAIRAFCERMQQPGYRVGVDLRSNTLDALSPLSHAPFDEIHLARELTRQTEPGSAGHKTLASIVSLAERADWTLVAHEVATRDALDNLAALGIDRFGGSVLGERLPLDRQMARTLAAADAAHASLLARSDPGRQAA